MSAKDVLNSQYSKTYGLEASIEALKEFSKKSESDSEFCTKAELKDAVAKVASVVELLAKEL